MSFDVVSTIGAFGGNIIYALLAFLVVLTVVVFFHELGHFLVARRAGVRVITFSIGFGPEIFGFFDRHGTRWKVSVVPLGGYVKFFGDENAASVPDQAVIGAMTPAEQADSFIYKPVGARAAIVAAGPIANFILAIVLFAGVFYFYGKPPPRDMHNLTARVDIIQEASPADKAGFKVGDTVIAVDGEAVANFGELRNVISAKAGKTVSVEVDRAGHAVTLTATPELVTDKDAFGNIHKRGQLGIQRKANDEEKAIQQIDNPITAVGLGFEETWNVITGTFGYIVGIFAGREAADQLGGPIMIAQASGQVAQLGVAAFIHFIGLISVSIGLLNLFPVPLLDGGHLLFFGFEAARGRPLSERVQEYGFRIGFALVLALMIFAAKNDILRLLNLVAS